MILNQIIRTVALSWMYTINEVLKMISKAENKDLSRIAEIQVFKKLISVIIPAHNEEKYIKRCIDSVKRAGRVFPGKTEIIVVCNRCTDKTEEIAKDNGAVVILNEDRCIAKVRNAGISAAHGDIIVTIDADNRMTKRELPVESSTKQNLG